MPAARPPSGTRGALSAARVPGLLSARACPGGRRAPGFLSSAERLALRARGPTQPVRAQRSRKPISTPARRPITSAPVRAHLPLLVANERREGTKRLLSVRPQGLRELDAFLAEVLPSSLDRLKAAAEREERAGRHARAAKRN